MNGNNAALVHRFHRFATKKCKPVDVGRLAFKDQLVLDSFVKGISVVKIPCNLVEASRTVMRTARYEQARTASGTICDITPKDLCVVLFFFLSFSPFLNILVLSGNKNTFFVTSHCQFPHQYDI